MQRFQIRKNGLEQVINVTMQPIKCPKKDGTKRKIKQTLVRHFVYQQSIFKHCTKKLNKEIEKVFMENWFVQLLKQEVIIYEVEQLVHYPRRWKVNVNIFGNNFQVP
jgi:hypothetical protein